MDRLISFKSRLPVVKSLGIQFSTWPNQRVYNITNYYHDGSFFQLFQIPDPQGQDYSFSTKQGLVR